MATQQGEVSSTHSTTSSTTRNNQLSVGEPTEIAGGAVAVKEVEVRRYVLVEQYNDSAVRYSELRSGTAKQYLAVTFSMPATFRPWTRIRLVTDQETYTMERPQRYFEQERIKELRNQYESSVFFGFFELPTGLSTTDARLTLVPSEKAMTATNEEATSPAWRLPETTLACLNDPYDITLMDVERGRDAGLLDVTLENTGEKPGEYVYILTPLPPEQGVLARGGTRVTVPAGERITHRDFNFTPKEPDGTMLFYDGRERLYYDFETEEWQADDSRDQ